MKNYFKKLFSESATSTDDKPKKTEVVEQVNLNEASVRSDGVATIKVISPVGVRPVITVRMCYATTQACTERYSDVLGSSYGF